MKIKTSSHDSRKIAEIYVASSLESNEVGGEGSSEVSRRSKLICARGRQIPIDEQIYQKLSAPNNNHYEAHEYNASTNQTHV